MLEQADKASIAQVDMSSVSDFVDRVVLFFFAKAVVSSMKYIVLPIPDFYPQRCASRLRNLIMEQYKL